VRIEKMTGQHFSEQYRAQVLGKTGSRLDSNTATLALTAVSLTEPLRELETLKLLQEARYVHGQDITSPLVVEKLLREAGLAVAADQLAADSAELHQRNDMRLQSAQRLMQTFGASGVPTLVLTKDGNRSLLRGDALFGSFENLINLLKK
jgi:putative protein-disulfide isomerase